MTGLQKDEVDTLRYNMRKVSVCRGYVLMLESEIYQVRITRTVTRVGEKMYTEFRRRTDFQNGHKTDKETEGKY
jgi:hypothetical protein